MPTAAASAPPADGENQVSISKQAARIAALLIQDILQSPGTISAFKHQEWKGRAAIIADEMQAAAST